MLDKKRVGTFILGGLTGVLAGILLAPKSGRETRGDIANRAGEAGQRSRESYFETGERLRERISATRDRSREASGPRETRQEKREVFVGHSDEPPRPEVHDVAAETGTAGGRPNLRDVSKDSSPTDDSRSEELRRKVEDTRQRIRSRMDADVKDEGGKIPDGNE